MARLAPEDPYAGLADPRPPGRAARCPTSTSTIPTEPAPEALEAQARAAEDAARAVPGVTNSDGGSASWSAVAAGGMVTSGGFSGLHRASGFSLGASAIAGDEDGMETRRRRPLRRAGRPTCPHADAIGAEAGRRAVGRLGARKIASTTAPVIFENRLAASLLGPLIGAISGPSIARGISFLKDKLGQPVFAKGVTVTDDPHRLRGLGSSPFDDEGVANQRRAASSTTAC